MSEIEDPSRPAGHRGAYICLGGFHDPSQAVDDVVRGIGALPELVRYQGRVMQQRRLNLEEPRDITRADLEYYMNKRFIFVMKKKGIIPAPVSIVRQVFARLQLATCRIVVAHDGYWLDKEWVDPPPPPPPPFPKT